MTRCALCGTYGPKCKLRIICSPERMTQECYVWGFGGPNRKESKWGTMIPHFLISTCCQDMTRTKKTQTSCFLVQDDIAKWHGRTKHTENNIFSPECIRIFRVASRCVRRVWDIWDQYANRKCKQEQVTQHCFLRNLEVQMARTATELLWSSHPNHPKAQTGHINRKASAIMDSNEQSWLNHLLS